MLNWWTMFWVFMVVSSMVAAGRMGLPEKS